MIMDDLSNSTDDVFDRVEITCKNLTLIAIANVATDFPKKTLGIYEEVQDILKTQENETVNVRPAERPESLGHIRDKLMGRRLSASHRRQWAESY